MSKEPAVKETSSVGHEGEPAAPVPVAGASEKQGQEERGSPVMGEGEHEQERVEGEMGGGTAEAEGAGAGSSAEGSAGEEAKAAPGDAARVPRRRGTAREVAQQGLWIPRQCLLPTRVSLQKKRLPRKVCSQSPVPAAEDYPAMVSLPSLQSYMPVSLLEEEKGGRGDGMGGHG